MIPEPIVSVVPSVVTRSALTYELVNSTVPLPDNVCVPLKSNRAKSPSVAVPLSTNPFVTANN